MLQILDKLNLNRPLTVLIASLVVGNTMLATRIVVGQQESPLSPTNEVVALEDTNAIETYESDSWLEFLEQFEQGAPEELLESGVELQEDEDGEFSSATREQQDAAQANSSQSANSVRATNQTPLIVNVSTVIPIPASGVYLGMNSGDENSGITVASQEALLGQQMAAERIFYPQNSWRNGISIDRIVNAHNEGRIPFVSYKVGAWKDVVAGESDAIIDELADKIKASGIPISLTFHHEPEDNACPNSRPDCGLGQTAADFVAMWRHIHDRFEAKQVDNVDWNWIVMGWQVSGQHWVKDEDRQKLIDMYPGDAYVDWISGDIYNDAGSCSFTEQEISDRWQSLEINGQGWYDWASSFGKPLALAEWGTFDDVLQPGRKAQWINDSLDTIKSWPNVKAALYFDRNHEGCDWRITTGGQSSVDAYKAFVNDPYVITGS